MSALLTIALVLLQADPAPTDPPATTQTPPMPILVSSDVTHPPLLREGTFLTRAIGTLDFDDASQSWIFRTEPTEVDVAHQFKRVFGLLPSMALDDMINHVERNGAQSRFEVTARVLLYNGRNFLLPSMSTPLGAPLVDEPDQEEHTDAADGRPSVAPTNSLDQDDGGVAARLEKRLRERIRALPRSSDVLGRDDTHPVRHLHEGMRLQNRRGAIVRDQRSGTFRFVFDAQGTATLDPTMEFLPCLLLAELENRAAESELPPAIHISGEVTSFRGRNYLLPTIWRPARMSRNIVP